MIKREMKKFITNKKSIMILLLLFQIIFSTFIYYGTILPICKNQKHNIYYNLDEDKDSRIYLINNQIKQEFVLKDNISSIVVYFNNDEEINEKSKILIELRNVKDNRQIKKWEIEGKEIQSSDRQELVLDSILNKDLEKYVIQINQEDKEGKISIQASNKDSYYDGDLFIGNEKQESDICFNAVSENSMFLTRLFWIFDILLILGIEIIYYCILIKKVKIEKMFVICGLWIGIIYMFLMTPHTISDESRHINTAYRYSNIWTNDGGYQADNGDMFKRESDTNIFGLNRMPSISSYYVVYSNFFSMAENEKMVQISGDRVGNITQYIPSSIGISIAKLLGIGYIPLIFLARLGNLIFYLLVIYFAIKKLPFGKITVCVIAMLPLAIQQAASVSYDAIVISVAIYAIASWLKLSYSNKKISIRDIITLIVSTSLLASCKAGIYIFICLLFLLISKQKYKNNKKVKYIVFGTMMFAVLTLIAFNYIKIYRTVTIQNRELSEYNQQIAYSYSYIWQNPLGFIKLLYNTILEKIDYYVIDTLGGYLGWHTIEMPIILVIAYSVLLIVSAFKEKDEEMYISKIDKIKIVLICMCIIGAFFTVALTWNPIDSKVIDGVRGRYFIPILPLIAILFRNKIVMKDKSIDREILFLVCFFQFITINSAFINIITK